MNFSIIIPTTNRPKQLKRLLLSIKNIQYDNKFEVLVVENGTLTSKSLLNSFSHFIDIKYHHIATPNISVARNLGITKSMYSKLIFVDDDITVGTHFLTGYKNAWLKYSNYSMVAGCIILTHNTNRTISFSENKILDQYPWCFAYQPPSDSDEYLSYGKTFSSANFSIKKTSSLRFNHNLGIKINNSVVFGGEDTEFCANLLLSNQKAVRLSDPRLCVKHFIGEQRFTNKYLIYRHLKSGVELLILENELIKKYGPIEYTYTQKLKMNMNTVIRLVVSTI